MRNPELLAKENAALNRELTNGSFTLHTRDGGLGLLFDFRTGIIYLLNQSGAEILSRVWQGSDLEDVQVNERPTIVRHALIHTLSATGGKLGMGVFPFNRREAAEVDKKETVQRNTYAEFVDALGNYGIPTVFSKSLE